MSYSSNYADSAWNRANKVATPAGVFDLKTRSARALHTVTLNALHDPAIGKNAGRVPLKDACNPSATNV